MPIAGESMWFGYVLHSPNREQSNAYTEGDTRFRTAKWA